jgi:capsular exopolysaccharide synthesis family protein
MDLSNIPKLVNNTPEIIDIRNVFLAFWRRIGLFLSVAFLITALATLFTLRLQPQYKATAKVMIDIQQSTGPDIQSIISGAPPDTAVVDTEVEVMKSLGLAEKVVAELNLIEDPEFNTDLREAKGLAKFKSWLSSLRPKTLMGQSSGQNAEENEKDRVVAEVLSHLDVYREGKTYIINIGFESSDARKTARIANAFSDNYLLEQLDAKFDATSRSNNWLNERLTELKAEVRSAENAVELYRGQSGLLSAQGSSLTEQQISDLNAQLIIQTASYNEAVARLDSVKTKIANGSPADTIGEVLASGVIIGLRGQQSEVAGRRAELSSRYGPRHPEVMKVEREAADVQAQIDQEIRRIVSNLESEAGIAGQKVRSIESGISRLRSELTSNNRSLVRLRELERDADASRTLYESFLERFKQTDDQESIAEADARVISKAVAPSSQSSPNTLFNIIMGMILGLVSGIGAIVLAEMLDNGLSTGADVEREIGLPFIASIPKLGGGPIGFIKGLMGERTLPDDYIVANPLSLFAESFRTLRSTILLSNNNKPPKVITVASALPAEGKTTAVRSLGRLSAMSGSRTVIVDCDLRLRQLSKNSETKPKAGLLKYLKGDAPLKDLIIRDEKTECDFILNSEDEYTNKDLFGTPAFAKMLTSLKRKYDLIILDTAPILLVAETRTIANVSDVVVVTTRWRKTKSDAVKTAANILKNVNANVIGIVLTRVNLRKRKRYGIGDYSYYAQQYKNYYTGPVQEMGKVEQKV